MTKIRREPARKERITGATLQEEARRLRRAGGLADVEAVQRSLLIDKSGKLIDPAQQLSGFLGGGELGVAVEECVKANSARLALANRTLFSSVVLDHERPAALAAELLQQLRQLATDIQQTRQACAETLASLSPDTSASILTNVLRIARLGGSGEWAKVQPQWERMRRRSYLQARVRALTEADELVARLEVFVDKLAGQHQTIQQIASMAAETARSQFQDLAASLCALPDDLPPNTLSQLLTVLSHENSVQPSSVIEAITTVLANDEEREDAASSSTVERVLAAVRQETEGGLVLGEDLGALLAPLVADGDSRTALRRLLPYLQHRFETAPAQPMRSPGLTLVYQILPDGGQPLASLPGGRLETAFFRDSRPDRWALLHLSTDHALADIEAYTECHAHLDVAMHQMNFHLAWHPSPTPGSASRPDEVGNEPSHDISSGSSDDHANPAFSVDDWIPAVP